MTDKEDTELDENTRMIRNLDIKMDNVSNVLGKIGLDFITKLGQMNMKFKMQNDKVDEMYKGLIDIKGLIPQISSMIERQSYIESELDLIKSLIQRTGGTPSTIERDESIIDKKDSITDKFNSILSQIDSANDPSGIKVSLNTIKEFIFEEIGGHRILYEISKEIKKLGETDQFTESFKLELKDKIAFWKNKF